jgi:FKBP-type peptidyl-prolyl cis-trans isomerase
LATESKEASTTAATGSLAAPNPRNPTPSTVSAPHPEEKLSVTTVSPGTGTTAHVGDRVSVHYVGTLTDGSKFDSSRDRDRPFEFVLGRGQVIRGWDQGVEGMRVGEKRRLVVPPTLGYGVRGAPPTIPSNATLVFDVELLNVQPAASP